MTRRSRTIPSAGDLELTDRAKHAGYLAHRGQHHQTAYNLWWRWNDQRKQPVIDVWEQGNHSRVYVDALPLETEIGVPVLTERQHANVMYVLAQHNNAQRVFGTGGTFLGIEGIPLINAHECAINLVRYFHQQGLLELPAHKDRLAFERKRIEERVQAERKAKRKPGKRRRKSLTTRFHVFKRDEFRCQMCGATAQDGARLEVDHKHPISRGGSNKAENLWTLCFDCNRGKRDELL